MKASIQSRVDGMIRVARSLEIDAANARRQGHDPTPYMNKAESLRRVVMQVRRRALLPVS